MSFEIAVTCLALNVFKEARGEPLVGQQAVALVTLNRVKQRGRHVCDIVFEKGQFSWTATDSRDGVLLPDKRPNRKSAEWEQATRVAIDAFYMEDFTGGATYFHEARSQPYWRKHLVQAGQWGNQIFYKEQKDEPPVKEEVGQPLPRDGEAGCDLEQRPIDKGGSCDRGQAEPDHRNWFQRLSAWLRRLFGGA